MPTAISNAWPNIAATYQSGRVRGSTPVDETDRAIRWQIARSARTLAALAGSAREEDPARRACRGTDHAPRGVTATATSPPFRIAPAQQRVGSARSVHRIAIGGGLVVRPLVLVLHLVTRVVQAAPDVVTGVGEVLADVVARVADVVADIVAVELSTELSALLFHVAIGLLDVHAHASGGAADATLGGTVGRLG